MPTWCAREGGSCVMVSLNWCGFSAVQALRRAHRPRDPRPSQRLRRVLAPSAARHRRSSAYQTLWRLAGVDHMHVHGLQGKFSQTDDEVIESARATACARSPMPPTAPTRVMPAFSSGQWAGTVPATWAACASSDLLFMSGGGILAHPGRRRGRRGQPAAGLGRRCSDGESLRRRALARASANCATRSRSSAASTAEPADPRLAWYGDDFTGASASSACCTAPSHHVRPRVRDARSRIRGAGDPLVAGTALAHWWCRTPPDAPMRRMDRTQRDLDKAFDQLEDELPDGVSRALEWLRSPKSRWVRASRWHCCDRLELLLVSACDRRPPPAARSAAARAGCAVLRCPLARFTLWLEAQWCRLKRWWRRRRARHGGAVPASRPRRGC